MHNFSKGHLGLMIELKWGNRYLMNNNHLVAVIKIDMMLTLLTDCLEEGSHQEIRVGTL